MIRLFICRHGNTFAAEETPRRVGARTDIPLVDSGLVQAKALGDHFKAQNVTFNRAFCSRLQRTRQTAEIIVERMGQKQNVDPLNFLNEIFYGPDENKTEEEVIARIGKEAIEKWDSDAIVPDGWDANPDFIIGDWLSFGDYAKYHFKDQNILLVTSNGTARFAPHLTGDFTRFQKNNDIKLKTGAYGIIAYDGHKWVIEAWNVRP
ncbi:MAG: histidine phosphatase family protein [Alphaproteobacteria bacterium]|nr:histidine phosphatase family protein [Alphaproteobacteria bacterium]